MEVGQYVRKLKGYTFEGEVRAVYTTRKGEPRVVVELIGENGNGMQHIFNPEQLERLERWGVVGFDPNQQENDMTNTKTPDAMKEQKPLPQDDKRQGVDQGVDQRIPDHNKHINQNGEAGGLVTGNSGVSVDEPTKAEEDTLKSKK